MMFMDSHYQLKEKITSQSQVTYPMDPDKPYTPVAIQDIASAYAAILRNPKPHLDRIYHLASDRFTMKELAKVEKYNYTYSLCRGACFDRKMKDMMIA